MNRIQFYINRALNQHREEYSNFSGGVLSSFLNADAPAVLSKNDVSQPYVLQISNSNNFAVANFDIMGASTYQYNNNHNAPPQPWAGGSLTNNGITISSAISNVTYQDVLTQATITPFTIGVTQIVVLNNTSQAFVPYTINTKDSNGNQALRVITPFLDLYQYQGGVSLVDGTPYSIDALTKITFSVIQPNAVFNVYMFPVDNYSQTSQQIIPSSKPDIVRNRWTIAA